MILLPLLLACGAGDCNTEDLAQGAVEATVDGAAWAGSGAQWSWAGDSVQISTAEADGWRLTVVAATDIGGSVLSQVLVDGAEVEVELGEGSFIAAYPTGVAGSYAANEAGDGSISIARDGDALSVCFDATGTASDGSTVQFSGGRMVAACAGECE